VPFSCPTVYDEILKWSYGRPEWQRDVLRRLLLNSSLGPDDIDEIFLLCKIVYGIEDGSEHNVAAIPLNESHICPDSGTGEAVRLTGIADVTNVNAITSSGPLTFGDSGLTIIYGDNGAGKSGYVRILKNLCRTREVDKKILSNVFESGEGRVPSAKIFFKTGAFDNVLEWEKDRQSPAELTCINMFDSGCASLYVNEDNRVVYMPLGLDIFDKLVKACDTIKARLAAEMEKIPSVLETLPMEHAETTVGKWYDGLKKNTPAEEVLKFASFSADEKRRLAELQKVLIEESKKKRAAELRMKKERYERLPTRIEAISSILSKEAIEKLKDLKSSFDTAVTAVKLASKAAFEKEEVKGIGSDAWRELWMAAKKFSETEVYPGQEFPNIGPKSKCVLCWQDLDLEPQAKKRMNRFKAFVLGEAANKETQARQKYEEGKDILNKIEISEHGDETLLKELKEDSASLEESLSSFLESAKNRKAAELKACETGAWEDIASLPEVAPAESIRKLCEELESQAKILEQAEDPEMLPKLQAEFDELSAKKWVSERRDRITSEITRLSLVSKYDAAISDTDTRYITKTSTVLTDKYVTEELKERFIKQLKTIYEQDLKVTLEKKEGEKGAAYYCVKLKGCAVPKTDVAEIISEGEFRAVALAAFLAEISLSPTKSGVVFDDPVSSLDHLIRENVAAELVKIAKDRQVIVFTHDLFFLVSLWEKAKKDENLPVLNQRVERGYSGIGVCYPDAPWDALGVTKRLGQLKGFVEDAAQKYKLGAEEYEKIAGFVCTKIRKTVERAVEEVLLADIVHRYRRTIYASKVLDLGKIRRQDLILLDDLMTRYSIQVHDQSEESKVKIPTPDKLKEDVTKLSEWIKEFRKR
jgi:energy-coupling factor transporter ATP-binding protein EcfA2